MPAEFENKFAWAKWWVDKNGMTLPPDTAELRSLRNWFCFKVDQYKKGSLGIQNETMLAVYGLDLSTYEALNVGRGERESDIRLIHTLIKWKAETGSYDLTDAAPDGLIEWQHKLLARFFDDGVSSRMKAISDELDGFEFGTWKRPFEEALPEEYVNWWREARKYEEQIGSFESFRGGIHPNAPKALRSWARAQQLAVQKGTLDMKKIGWLRKHGIVDHKSRYLTSATREKALLELRGGADANLTYGRKERRLSSMLGALLAIKLVIQRRPDREICVEMRLLPVHAVALRKQISATVGDMKLNKAILTDCRMLCLNDPNAFSPGFWSAIHQSNGSEMPTRMNEMMMTLGKLAYEVVQGGYDKHQLTDVY